MKENSEEEQKIQQAKNNILRGEDIDSATYILEKVIFDNVFFIGGRVNPLKVATRQVINFIKRYQKSDYETICLENNELKEKNERLESENQEFLYKYGNILKENEKLKEYKKIAELTKISCCIAQNCEALNNAIKKELENQRLEKENETLKKLHIQDNNKLDFVMKHCILEQKIKDKIEELYKEDREWTEELSEPDCNFKNINRNLKRIKNQTEVLKGLLESEDNNARKRNKRTKI